MGADIPVDRSIRSYQNLVNFKSWHSYSFYLIPGRCYASCQLSELTTIDFGANFKKINIINSLFGSKSPLLLLLLWVKLSLLKTPGLNPSESLVPNWGVLYFGAFSDKDHDPSWSTDSWKILGVAKLYYNARVTFPLKLRFLLITYFLATFTYAMQWWLLAKNNKNNIFNVGINSNYFITRWLIKMNSTSVTLGEWETNACFARSKLMGLNNFFIRSNALSIWLTCNLIKQSHGDRFRECINK